MKKSISYILTTVLLSLPSVLFAQDANSSVPPNNDFWQTLTMIGITAAALYLILWRPEQKRRKETEKMREVMKKGDKVIAMGIVGTVSRVLEETVILRMVDGAKIEVLKGTISEVQPSDANAKDNGDKD